MIATAIALGSFVLTASSSAFTPGSTEDLEPPIVGSVRVDQHGNGRATVSWSTNEVTLGHVEYSHGEGGGEALSVEPSDGPGHTHSVSLRGLAEKTDYVFFVRSSDSSGNVTRTEVGGFQSGGRVSGAGFEVAGRLQPWHPITLSFPGPFANEGDMTPNPFLDYRLTVELTSPSGEMATIPGYFAGDGEGGGSGDVWRVRFPVHREGTWTFVARFRQGTEVAVSSTPWAGSPAAFDGTNGTFEVQRPDPEAPGFYRWGKLFYVGEHYLKFMHGPWFIKGGTNSPENLFAYAGFDNTIDQGGANTYGLINGLHRYAPHVADWGPAGGGTAEDPFFTSADTGVDSRGIVGALNYLASRHVNSIFILPMNLGGDGQEVCPFVGFGDTRYDKTHYDISKLWQWDQVLEHTARLGIVVQFVLGETEVSNEQWLDNGHLGIERKLFYREMVARFGHLPAIKWNIAEECEYSTTRILEFANYIRQIDVFEHPIGFHVNVLPVSGESNQYDAVLGNRLLSTNSMQAIPYTASDLTEKWRADSAAAGQKWVVEFDEQTNPLTDTNAAELRKISLYDTLFSGGHIEWYAGYFELPLGGDLRIEDFRMREEMWDYTWYARKFLEENVPFWLMEPMDELVSNEANDYGGAEVLALPGYSYAIYYPNAAATGELDLREVQGTYRARWYNPRTGSYAGALSTLQGGARVPVGFPPHSTSADWVLHVQR